jgi:hypothetical protein
MSNTNYLTTPRFLVQRSPGKRRLFLLDGDAAITAVATLDPADGDVDEVAAVLNDAVLTGERELADKTLSDLPTAVAVACRQALADLAPLSCQYGRDRWSGEPVRDLTEAEYMTAADVAEYADAAMTLDFGVWASNYRDEDGSIHWEATVLSAPTWIPAGGDPRAWPLPADVPLAATHHPVSRDLLAALRDVEAESRWARLHWVWQGDTTDPEADGSATAEWVLDVFDSPPPVHTYDDEE